MTGCVWPDISLVTIMGAMARPRSCVLVAVELLLKYRRTNCLVTLVVKGRSCHFTLSGKLVHDADLTNSIQKVLRRGQCRWREMVLHGIIYTSSSTDKKHKMRQYAWESGVEQTDYSNTKLKARKNDIKMNDTIRSIVASGRGGGQDKATFTRRRPIFSSSSYS